MEAPRSNISSYGGEKDLIRDIGLSRRRSGCGVTSEQWLMRLASDPLLVREHIFREEPPEPMVLVALPMSSDTSIALARSILAGGSLEHAGEPAGFKQYQRWEPLLESSLSPTVFKPSRHDYDLALVDDSLQQARVYTADSTSRMAFAVFTLAAFLIVLVLLGAPD